MAPSRKSRHEKSRVPETPTPWKLPTDLMLEIVARSNHRTLLRCAAACKLLRREILSQPLDRRVTQAAPCILAYLCADAKKPLTVVHPSTGAASSFCHKHLPRFLSRDVVTLLGKYRPVSSRRGLIVLYRQKIKNRPKFDLCVYDPMSGAQTFFSDSAVIQSDQYRDPKYVVLTAADGIGDSFLLLVFDLPRWYPRLRVNVASSSGTWKHVRYGNNPDFPWGSIKKRGDPAILSGGVVHWLPCRGKEILSYDLGTGMNGSVKLPPTNCNVNYDGNKLYLATSADGKLLKLLAIQGFIMFVWLQLPVSAADGSGWSLETVIDMEEKLRSLDPDITAGPGGHIEFEGSGKRTGEVVLLVEVRRQGYADVYSDALIVFDLETKKMHRQKPGLSLLEIDLPSRLQTMKIFS